MKIAVAQINTTVGDFDGNTAKIIDRIRWAGSNGVDMVVFPEMATTGYPPKDLLEKRYFVDENLKVLRRITEKTEDIAAVVGHISVNGSDVGKGLFNSAAILHKGKVVYIQNKTLLPTYDVFDEARYFEPGRVHEVVRFKGRRFGVTICEDIWSTATFMGRKLYTIDPVKILAGKGAEFIVNLSASPYMIEKRAIRRKLLSRVAGQYRLPIVYTNLVGGNDALIFDGSSAVVDREGVVAREARPFVEDSFIVDIDDLKRSSAAAPLTDAEEIYDALVLGLHDYAGKCGFKKALIGLSGGIDSSVVACIAVDALGPGNVMGIAMPTRFSGKEGVEDASELARRLGCPFKIIDIDATFQNYLDLLTPYFEGRGFDTTEENIQARIRGDILMSFSNKFGALVLSTGNKSELAVGYCTLYGDLSGGLSVIADVPKTMVYKLADHINRGGKIIPVSVFNRPPSAELRPDQTDQDSLPPYDVLDKILKAYIEEHRSPKEIVKMGFDREVVDEVLLKVGRSEYKRWQAPPALKVTSKAFGLGRRFPIARRY